MGRSSMIWESSSTNSRRGTLVLQKYKTNFFNTGSVTIQYREQKKMLNNTIFKKPPPPPLQYFVATIPCKSVNLSGSNIVPN